MDFQTHYNAMEQAKLVMIQRLIFEIAELKGEEGERFIESFRNACVTEINDTKDGGGGERPTEVSRIARTIVEGVSAMAKDRLSQRRAEGGP